MTPEISKQAIESFGQALEMLALPTNDIEADYKLELKKVIKTSSDKIVITNETIDKEMKLKIQKLLNENSNLNSSQLSDLIDEQIDNDFLKKYSNRSKTIAVTTSTLTIGNSQNTVANKHKAKKRWLSMRDDRVRDAHVKADGTYPDELGLFNIGGEELSYPGGGNKGDNNINCRCRLRLEKV